MVSGTYTDIYLPMFQEGFQLEAQQFGSRLAQTCMKRRMATNEFRIKKIGKIDAGIVEGRFEKIALSDQSYEYRGVEPITLHVESGISPQDLIRMAENPTDATMRSLVAGMGRKEDAVIAAAIQGNASVTASGSTTATALSLSVAANSTLYGSGTGATSLTPQKLKEAIAKMTKVYGYSGMEKLWCVGKAEHIMNLAINTEIISADYRPNFALEGPGILSKLSGYMGINFVVYEDFANVSGSEPCYLYTDQAIHHGTWKDFSAQVVTDKVNFVEDTDILKCNHTMGAVRDDEVKVVEILCTSIL